MSTLEITKEQLVRKPRRWLVTGVAGFIGSHLLETLLGLKQEVIGLDNFSTGKQANLDDVRRRVGEQAWQKFTFYEADIRNMSVCREVSRNVEIILHHAALGSVPRSIKDPLHCNENNVTGTLNIFQAAGENRVRRVVYASSSAVYGDHPGLPKFEDRIGTPLSPYAVTKYVNELYAGIFSTLYEVETIGLRYFNVFGPRQDPAGAYAAVIPCWIAAMIKGDEVRINGTGETSRDFCYVNNVVQMNLLAATTSQQQSLNQIYNTALNERTTLNELFEKLRTRLFPRFARLEGFKPVYHAFRQGDVLHSQADISKARLFLGYEPTHTIDQGLDAALEWYVNNVE
jgi:UDP-N-acetylglucosamine 4-epimerase